MGNAAQNSTKRTNRHKTAQTGQIFVLAQILGGMLSCPLFLQVCLHDGKIGVDYAIRMKLYNPLFRMVARFFSYIIVHVGDFILSLLRLYLCFFRTFIYGFLHTWG